MFSRRTTHPATPGALPAALLAAAVVLTGCVQDEATNGGNVSTDGDAPTTADDDTASGSVGVIEAFSEQMVAVASDVTPSVVAVRGGTGEGSGVVWSEAGTIVTNAHVVRGESTVDVVFVDGIEMSGEVVAADPISDIAVVEVDRDDLPAAEWSDELPDIGEVAVAVGNPLGFEGSVTAGIVSGLARSIPGGGPSLVDLVQTDAPISPGNSGGALVDASGQVIGVNVAYVPPAAGAASIGFAIPSPTVADVVGELLEFGQARHAYLGIRPSSVRPQGMDGLGPDAEGVLVQAVEPAAPAARGGVEGGDVITGVDGGTISGLGDLFTLLRQRDPGDDITLDIVRDGERQELSVTLADWPESEPS